MRPLLARSWFLVIPVRLSPPDSPHTWPPVHHLRQTSQVLTYVAPSPCPRLAPDTLAEYACTAGISMTRMTGCVTFSFPFHFPVPTLPSAERTPVSSRRWNVITLDQPTRIFPVAKSRPAPLTLERASSESHVSIVRSNSRTPTLVLRPLRGVYPARIC